MKMYLVLNKTLRYKDVWGVEIQRHALLTSVLDGSERSVSRPGSFTPGQTSPSTHWTGSRVDSRAGLGGGGEDKKSLPLPGRPARTGSLVTILRYPSSLC